MRALGQHFDDSRKQVQAEADRLLSQVAVVQGTIDTWVKSLPRSDQVYPELHEDLETALATESSAVKKVMRFLDDVKDLLFKKRESPERTELAITATTPHSIGVDISEILKAHNDIVAEAGKRQTETAQAILKYLVGSQSISYQELHDDETSNSEELERLIAEIKQDEALLKEAKAQQYSSHEMATQITRDLASIYGKAHLSIEVSDDGQSYLCRRESQPARHLSEGERNTLALIYFLRLLQDESTNVEPTDRIVVVDDPSSSLDREAVFATHSWLLDALPLYGQSIILTHDFEMLRLLLASQSNQLSKHRGTMRGLSGSDSTKQAAAQREKAYPRISFLEMRSKLNTAGSRYSALSPISDVLLDHNSEYHFLFDRVVAGLENPDDHVTLFLLPNAARRLLETFASFHAPDRPNFLDQLTKLAVEDRDSEYRDVYDFCNRFSHGEGRETQVVLDVHTTQQQIRRCVEFLQAVDPEHYRDMCRATGRGTNDPLSAPPP